MAKLRQLQVSNFRGLQYFEHSFSDGITCIIGRGDSGKTTIIDAISLLFSHSWSVRFDDSDFYKCDTTSPIVIEGVVSDVPDELISKFANHLRGLTKDGKIVDDMESEDAKDADLVITIRLSVPKELEPTWEVVSYNGEDNTTIKAADRSKLNVFSVADYTDRHFSMNKGNPLYSLYKELNGGAIQEKDNKVLEVVREAKSAFDGSIGNKFDVVIGKVKKMASSLGISMNDMKALLDFRDISISENNVSIHEDGIPLRLKGKGSKRLLSLSIQLALTQPSGVILIDEVEQGLEPDRVQHLVSILAKHVGKQVIITTHSSNVIVEIPCECLFIMRKDAQALLHVEGELQGSIRKNPEAFFAKKVLVCEGATEVGFCRAINNWRINLGEKSSAYIGVRFADGSGNSMAEYVIGFSQLGYTTGLFCDSDEVNINNQKSKFKSQNITVVDCEDNLSIEQQVFKDVPWVVVKELISLAIRKIEIDDCKTHREAEESVYYSTNYHLAVKMSTMEHWYEKESIELRNALGEAAKKKEWYKKQTFGERLGEIILNHYNEMDVKCQIKKEIDTISNWINS